MKKILNYVLAAPVVSSLFFASFSALVTALDRCFPGSLDGTYLRLFFPPNDANV
jgi:Photosystem I reaction centre subunit IX / PsaJ